MAPVTLYGQFGLNNAKEASHHARNDNDGGLIRRDSTELVEARPTPCNSNVFAQRRGLLSHSPEGDSKHPRSSF